MGKVNSTTCLKHQYNYFDQYHQLQSRHLNIFQRFLRNVFGRYASTHLTAVVNKAYNVTLNDQFQGNTEKKTQLLNLFAKANRGIYLAPYSLAKGNMMVPYIHYNITPDKRAISSVDFKLNLLDKNGKKTNLEISIIKNREGKYVARFDEDRSLKSEMFINDSYSSAQAIAVNDFVAKIINDNATAQPSIAEIWRYIPNYNSYPVDNPQTISKKIDEAMVNLGWEFLKYYSNGANEKCIYLFRKEEAMRNQNVANCGFKQSISLEFAVSALAKQNDDF